MSAVITAPTTTLPAWLAGISGALPDALAAAKVVIDGGFAPKDCKGPQSIVVAAAMGNRLGLDFFSSIYGIAVINNRPSIFGDAMLAVCQNHPQWEDFKEEWTGKKYDDDFTAVCRVKRKGRDWKEWTYCVKDAMHGGLWKKAGPWTTAPQRMLMMRARAFALRDVYADVLAGFHSREEMEDTLVDVTSSATVRDEPKDAKVRREVSRPAKITQEIETKAEEPAADADKPAEETKTDTAPQADQAPKLVTIPDVKARVAELWKTTDGKQLVKDHMATWKLAGIDALGELPPEEPGRFLEKLNEIVATHIQIKGALK